MIIKIENPPNSNLKESLLDASKAEANKKPSWSERFDLVKDYFIHSNEKLSAWLLVFGIIFCVVGFIALNVFMGWLFTGVWAALTASAFTPFLIALGELAAALCGMTMLYALQNFFSGKLAINWRYWLSKKIMKQLYGEKEYINVKRTSGITDISQRIQEDVRQFVELSISLGSEFINSTLSLGVFVGALWVLGGTLAFVAFGLNFIIPGYLVWAAIIIAVIASLVTYGIGKSLPSLNEKEEQAEALLRQNLETLNVEAENISLERAEDYHVQSIALNMEDLEINASKKLGIQTILVAFQSFYANISLLVPYLLTAPLYFTGCIALELIGQVGMSFSQVSQALSWFAQSYEKITTYQTKMDRIIEIQQAIKQGVLKANPMNIVIEENESTSLIMQNLNIQKPLLTNTNHIIHNLNLELQKSDHTLIVGASGLGKSTLFKAIRGTWSYGDGEIKVPKGKSQFFLSQKPTVVNDTLRAMLAYPKKSTDYTKKECLRALESVEHLKIYIPDLKTKRDWSGFLSAGEKQMIAFARALLHKPDWLFVDEITSSLDENAEYKLYELLKTKLPDTTIVSIAHRSTVKIHHNRMITFGCPNQKGVMEIVSDDRINSAI